MKQIKIFINGMMFNHLKIRDKVNSIIIEIDDEIVFGRLEDDSQKEVEGRDASNSNLAVHVENTTLRNPTMPSDTHTKDYGHKDLIDKDYDKEPSWEEIEANELYK